MSVQITWELAGTGWADFTIRVDAAVATVSASYLSDALDDLSSAVAAALRGHPRAVASLTEEPGEYRWIFETLRKGNVRLRILEFKEMWSGRPDAEGAILFDATCRLRTLAGALVSAMQEVERKHGLAGYREKWVQHDFPAGRLRELQELLSR